MGAEIGATTSVFPFGPSMTRFLNSTNRSAISDLASKYQHVLSADENAHYDELIEINLSELEPHVNGPFTPDLAHPISKLGANAKANNWPLEVKVGELIVSFMLPLIYDLCYADPYYADPCYAKCCDL